ncbi:hypothetical protein Hanom_Chr04g00382411 [Helianthus anomalus]
MILEASARAFQSIFENMFLRKSGLKSTGFSMIFSGSIRSGKLLVTPLMFDASMLWVSSLIVGSTVVDLWRFWVAVAAAAMRERAVV